MDPQMPSESSPPTSGAGRPAETFFENASLGSNAWWRWTLGIIAIILVWMVIGAIPWLVACEYLIHSSPGNFSCNGNTISGDSAVPEFVLGFYPFVIGIIGVWLAVRLLHRKSMTRVVTGRPTFDYNRVLFAMGVEHASTPHGSWWSCWCSRRRSASRPPTPGNT